MLEKRGGEGGALAVQGAHVLRMYVHVALVVDCCGRFWLMRGVRVDR